MTDTQPQISRAHQLLDELAQLELDPDERDRMIAVALVNTRWEQRDRSPEVSAVLRSQTQAAMVVTDLVFSMEPALAEKYERMASEARARVWGPRS